MPSAPEGRAARDAAVLALERACIAVDAAIAERDWDAMRERTIEQARLLADLEARVAADPALGAPADPSFAARMRRIGDYRAQQLARLHRYREGIAERLEAIGRWRRLDRTMGGSRAVDSRVLDQNR